MFFRVGKYREAIAAMTKAQFDARNHRRELQGKVSELHRELVLAEKVCLFAFYFFFVVVYLNVLVLMSLSTTFRTVLITLFLQRQTLQLCESRTAASGHLLTLA